MPSHRIKPNLEIPLAVIWCAAMQTVTHAAADWYIPNSKTIHPHNGIHVNVRMQWMGWYMNSMSTSCQ